MSFPLVGNLSDLFGIVKKDAGQASMTKIQTKDLKQLLRSLKINNINGNSGLEIQWEQKI
jgi:hypothetical protein